MRNDEPCRITDEFVPDYTDQDAEDDEDVQCLEMETIKEKVDSFVEELTELTKKYGLEIWGCDCCGAPGLRELVHDDKKGHEYKYDAYEDDGEILVDGLRWTSVTES